MIPGAGTFTAFLDSDNGWLIVVPLLLGFCATLALASRSRWGWALAGLAAWTVGTVLLVRGGWPLADAVIAAAVVMCVVHVVGCLLRKKTVR